MRDILKRSQGPLRVPRSHFETLVSANLHAYTLLLSSDLLTNMPSIPISGPSYLLFILPIVSPPRPTTWLFTCIALSHHLVLCCAKSLQLYPTLCNPMDCRPPGSSVHRILQARILEWVVMPSSFGLHLKCQFTLSRQPIL